MTDDHFGALRSLLQQPPSAQTWAQVSAWAQAQPELLEREDISTYLGDMLKAWPEAIERFVTVPLLDELLQRPNIEHPWLVATSGLVFTWDDLSEVKPESTRRLKMLRLWINAAYIHEVRLGYEGAECDSPQDIAATLSAGQHWRGLKRLSIYADWLDDDGMARLGMLNFPSLEVLELKGSLYFSPDGVEAFRQGEKLPKHILEMKLHPARSFWDDEMQCWE